MLTSKILDMSLRPNKARMKVLIVLLILSMVIDVAEIISESMQINLLREFLITGMADLKAFARNDLRVMILAIVGFIVGIGTIVVFIMWFRRGYYNLHQLRNDMNHSEGWAAGAWFIPFLNLGRPVSIMSEMSNKTYELLTSNKLISKNNQLKWIIPIWWTLWIIVNQIGNVITRQAFKNPTGPEEFISRSKWIIFSSTASILLTVITILMIIMYSRFEKLLPMLAEEKKNRKLQSDKYDLLDTI